MRAGVLVRGVAAFFDWLIMMLGAGLLVFLMIKLSPSYSKDLAQIARIPAEMQAEHVRGFYLGGIVLLPYIFLEAFFGTSPGKFIMRLRIAHEDGARASVGRLLLRFFVKYGYVVLFLAGGMVAGLFGGKAARFLLLPASAWSAAIFFGYLMALGESRQTLHDKIAGTAVFDIRDLAESGLPKSPAPLPPRLRPRSERNPNDLYKPRW